MRVFEILAAGGFLLTDRLSPQAGLEQLLRPGQDYEPYGNADELISKLEFYRRSPLAALRIAEQGAATYQRSLLAEDQLILLRDWIFSGRLPDTFNPRHDLRAETTQATARCLDLRIAIYERLQECQRTQDGLSVLVSPGWPAQSVLDLADLVRTRLSVIRPANSVRALAAAASVLTQIEFVEADKAMKRSWDFVLTASSDASKEPWRNRATRVIFADFDGDLKE